MGDKDFNLYRKVQFETRIERGYTEILNEFHQHIEELLNEFSKEKLKRIGISCGGPLDSKEGVPAAIQNDANACALAEWLMGAGKGTQNMIFLTFGTGMGSGLILNGKLYAGTNDLGGEVGHIRQANDGPVGFGKAGSFEGFCSGGGIALLAHTLVSEKLKSGEPVTFCPDLESAAKLTAKDVALAARDGDPTAAEIIRISGEYLGRGLAVLIDVLNPQCIVIGSIYARNEELFKPHVDRIFKKEAIPSALEVCQIKPAVLGDSIGDYAALCVAVYENEF